MKPINYDFTRYLEVKKSIDDASLNRRVWQKIADSLPASSSDNPLKVIEIGAGIGTMLIRMIEWGLFDHAVYTGIDNQTANSQYARIYLQSWAVRSGYQVQESNQGLILTGNGKQIVVNLLDADLFAYIASHTDQDIDLLVANAFLDLVPLPRTLDQILNWVQQDYLFYFSINYDGLTILEPVIDPEFDALVLDYYHETMNERLFNGIHYGDHQTGRHLLDHIRGVGGRILAAGSSDWIVFPESGGYSADETYFLHFIINTIESALHGHTSLDVDKFTNWISRRHEQIENGELVYIAHQLDIMGNARAYAKSS
jgi:SAM-dependent methyltransferase